VVYTDIATNAIRMLTTAGVSTVAGSPVENAGFTAGDFRDGTSDVARVDQPMGLVRLANGTFVFSDTGNRRIRAVSGIDFRYQTEPSDLAADSQDYRIFFIGNSDASSNQEWDQSISGILERRLRQNWRALGFPKPPRVYPRQVIAGVNETADWIDTYLASGLADMVILQLNAGQVTTSLGQPIAQSLEPNAAQWQPMVTNALRSIHANLSKNGIPFLVVLDPLAFEVSPAESGWIGVYPVPGVETPPGPPSEYAHTGEMLREAAVAAGVPVANAFPAFKKEVLLASHPALFGARDFHLSVQGVALESEIVLNELLTSKPWKRP
ncbi:MAG: hypothetical protein JO199_04165, partial [Candidatus Eremiobacteraeota bacterium]|nr:hypothetical protein [Candidatus Eremiobacteraeota bacterium]